MLHDNKVDKQDSTDTLNLVRIILQQNYFQYKDSFYKPKTGIAMSSPPIGHNSGNLSTTLGRTIAQTCHGKQEYFLLHQVCRRHLRHIQPGKDLTAINSRTI
jgi:hypothetical protein